MPSYIPTDKDFAIDGCKLSSNAVNVFSKKYKNTVSGR